MRKKYWFVLMCMSLLSFSLDGLAGFYKCMDDQGQVNYKDSPCEGKEKLKKEFSQREIESMNAVQTGNRRPAVSPPENPPSSISKSLKTSFIKNGHFNKNLMYWTRMWEMQWNGVEGHAKPGSAMVIAHSEKHSMGKLAFSQCVNFDSPGPYEAGASAKLSQLSNQQGGGRLRIIWRTEQGCRGDATIDSQYAKTSSLYDWQRIGITGLYAPKNTRSASVQIIQSVKGPGSFVAFWDDVFFKLAE